MLASLALLVSAAAVQDGNSYCKVQLLSEVKSYQTGKPFTLGLKFKISEKWHIYWRNPGDSGQEPQVKWNLPKGWKAGSIRWPKPTVLESGGNVNFGYQGEAMLLVDITPSSTHGAVRGAVEWLVCSEKMCLPGGAAVSLSIPKSSSPQPSASVAQSFQAARQSLPKKLNHPASARTQGGVISLKLGMTVPEGAKVSFLPYDPAAISHEQPQSVHVDTEAIELRLKKSQFAQTPPKRLTGDLLISSPGGDAFYTINVPIQQSGGRK